MKMMKEFIFNCEVCQKNVASIRSIKSPPPRFCGNDCRQHVSGKFLQSTKFVWHEATEEQKTTHLKQYFEKNIIRRKDACWDWKKLCKTERYPRMNPCRSAPKIAIHRYSWESNFGEIPEKLHVLHKCDNTRCSNPEHLFLGTDADNVRDCIKKGRNKRGSSHHGAKLDEKKVKQIKRMILAGISCSRLASDYGVGYDTIRRIKIGLTWSHVK